MALRDVLISLNDIKTAGIIQDYAIGGGYAVMFYDVPMEPTYDLDVLVILATEDDYHRLYEHFRIRGAKIKDVYIFIEDMPVQFLPNYISPLFNSAIEEANIVEFEGVSSKFVTVEYLTVLLLTSYRPKDRMRIEGLLKKVDEDLLLDIIQRSDNDQGDLYKRYKEVLAGT
ncbi:MAG: hypothetical protein ISS52_07280 [Dehalococcoidia bacterium]|nr:hypothetical protein [Dehalococcoidia bacterium]